MIDASEAYARSDAGERNVPQPSQLMDIIKSKIYDAIAESTSKHIFTASVKHEIDIEDVDRIVTDIKLEFNAKNFRIQNKMENLKNNRVIITFILNWYNTDSNIHSLGGQEWDRIVENLLENMKSNTEHVYTGTFEVLEVLKTFSKSNMDRLMLYLKSKLSIYYTISEINYVYIGPSDKDCMTKYDITVKWTQNERDDYYRNVLSLITSKIYNAIHANRNGNEKMVCVEYNGLKGNKHYIDIMYDNLKKDIENILKGYELMMEMGNDNSIHFTLNTHFKSSF